MAFFDHNKGNSSTRLGQDVATNRMLTGATQVVSLKGGSAGEKFFQAGLVLRNETVRLQSTGSIKAVEYQTSTDSLTLYLGQGIQCVNMYGEDVAFDANSFLKGATVVLSSSLHPRLNGTYTYFKGTVSGDDDFIEVVGNAPNSFFGESDLGLETGQFADVAGTANNETISCTVLPFPPAFCVEMLGHDDVAAGETTARHKPLKFKMNNIAGATIENSIDFPDGQVVYGEITEFEPENDANARALLYLQDKPSLDYSPYKLLPSLKLSAASQQKSVGR